MPECRFSKLFLFYVKLLYCEDFDECDDFYLFDFDDFD